MTGCTKHKERIAAIILHVQRYPFKPFAKLDIVVDMSLILYRYIQSYDEALSMVQI